VVQGNETTQPCAVTITTSGSRARIDIWCDGCGERLSFAAESAWTMTDRDRAMTSKPNPLDLFRAMLDQKNWPVRPNSTWFILNGEIYQYVTEHPLEERVYKPLFSGALQ
jgi:hypothetical protein